MAKRERERELQKLELIEKERERLELQRKNAKKEYVEFKITKFVNTLNLVEKNSKFRFLSFSFNSLFRYTTNLSSLQLKVKILLKL